MRRTYKSKKDAAGALDPRDTFLNMDEKSSAFDAFYIQNIKQTKREQSCMGSSNNHGVAANKVRKRKYVKRIVKDVEPVSIKSLSGSVFLTPDKSLRVNKGPNLFDQLLKSSPAWLDDNQVKKDDPFDKLLGGRVAKTYTKKKAKYNRPNYSSSDYSESDKENTKDYERSHNITNIKTHELVVEKERKSSPKFDVSINKIVNNLSLLNNLKCKTSIGSQKNKFNKNRLTYNIQSPIVQNSPLSSTPFTEKFKSKSIYKFSPIPMRDLEESINYVTVHKENYADESIILVPKSTGNSAKVLSMTPDTHLSIDKSRKANSKPLFSSVENESPEKDNSNKAINSGKHESEESDKCKITLQTSEMEPFLGFTNNIKEADCSMSSIDDETQNKSIIISAVRPKSKQKTSGITSEQIEIEIDKEHSNSATIFSDVELTYPSQPFIGFSKVKSRNDISSNSKGSKDEDQEETKFIHTDIHANTHLELDDNRQSFEVLEISNNHNLEESSENSHEELSDDNSSTKSHVKGESLTYPSQPYTGFSKVESFNDTFSNSISSKDNDQEKTEVECIDIYANTITRSELDENGQSFEVSDISNKNSDELSDDNSLTNLYEKGESLYDTCCNSDNSVTSSKQVKVTKKEPIVTVEKMSKTLLEQYLYKIPVYESQSNKLSLNDDDESQYDISDDYASFDCSSEQNDKSQSVYDCEQNNSYSEADNISRKESEQEITKIDDTINVSVEEETCSFVTTRRRNEVLYNSLSILDASNDSISSTGCDETVLENHKKSLEKANYCEDLANCTLEYGSACEENFPTKIMAEDDTRILSMPRYSVLNNLDNTQALKALDTTMKPKPSIVLQPGKKWERSLSIYKRITMINDHFDESVLEDEDLQSKGRKYRQSVISTMEMQEKGVLHNDLSGGRRSTLIVKLSKPTIRIVKETNSSKKNINIPAVVEDFSGYLEDCDDTIVELSKLSIDDHVSISKFHDSSRTVPSPAREYVLRRCNQSDTILFDECYPDALLKNCRKIGEGVYGEVYLWRAPDGLARVMKIVPIAGTTRVNGEHQKDFHEIISEIVIAMELSALRAPIADIERHFDEGKEDKLNLHAVGNATDIFNEVLAVRCVYGSYPTRLLDLWELYDETKGSENDNPAILPVDQQYIVLELANAGQDLESYQFNNAEQAYSLFYQVAFGLAVGEEAFQFEHRDLHWGNVLIAPTDQAFATFLIRGRVHRVPRRGVAATIIDYSLSRLSLPLAREYSRVSLPHTALYNDLAEDEGLFTACGDYQFQVYRLMRDKLENKWKNFEPYTNILWLHYTVDKMITALRYKRTNTKTHKQYINKLKGVKERILNYDSAANFVLTDIEY